MGIKSGKKSIQTSEDLVLMPGPTCVLWLDTLMMIFVQFLLSVAVEIILRKSGFETHYSFSNIRVIYLFSCGINLLLKSIVN